MCVCVSVASLRQASCLPSALSTTKVGSQDGGRGRRRSNSIVVAAVAAAVAGAAAVAVAVSNRCRGGGRCCCRRSTGRRRCHMRVAVDGVTGFRWVSRDGSGSGKFCEAGESISWGARR